MKGWRERYWRFFPRSRGATNQCQGIGGKSSERGRRDREEAHTQSSTNVSEQRAPRPVVVRRSGEGEVFRSRHRTQDSTVLKTLQDDLVSPRQEDFNRVQAADTVLDALEFDVTTNDEGELAASILVFGSDNKMSGRRGRSTGRCIRSG